MNVRSHVDAINETLQGNWMIADFGSGGAEQDVPSLVVCGSDDIELGSRRILVSASLAPQDTLADHL